MDTPKKNKLAMYEAVDTVLNGPAYQPVWKDMTAFATDANSFSTVKKQIIELSPQTGRRKTGVPADKDAARTAMCKAANIIAGSVASYAHKAGNHELLTRVDTSLSILMGGRGQDSRDKCADILAAATANLAALADYEVKQADLDSLNALITAFDVWLPATKVALGKLKTAGQKLEALFDQGDGLLNNSLDKLMLKFEDSNPDFFHDYMTAREITDLPGGHHTGNPPPPPPTEPPAK